ncbi:hypothetical protein AB5N19_03090 [Seiridium cardinale]
MSGQPQDKAAQLARIFQARQAANAQASRSTPRQADPSSQQRSQARASSALAQAQENTWPRQGEQSQTTTPQAPTHQAQPRSSPSNFTTYGYLTLPDGCQLPVDEFCLPATPQVPIHTEGRSCSCSGDGNDTAASIFIAYAGFAQRAWGWSEAQGKEVARARLEGWPELVRDRVQERIDGRMDLALLQNIQKALREMAKKISGADGPRARLWEGEDEVAMKVRKHTQKEEQGFWRFGRKKDKSAGTKGEEEKKK